MMKIAILYLAHDGFTSLYTGVGTVARDFLLSFPEVYKRLKKGYGNLDITLFVATIKYNKSCFGYSEDIKRLTEVYTEKHKNMHLVELVNGSAGTKSYGSIDLWKNACISAATFIYCLTNYHKYDRILVICVDTPFAQVANYFFDQYQYKNIDFVWLPQSTVIIHKIDSALGKSFKQNSYLKERCAWEKAVINLAKKNKQVKIGCVSNFMAIHLTQSYHAKKDSLVSLQNGIYFKRLKSYRVDQEKISNILKSLGVPLGRPLLFSFGRAEPYKGLDLVIRNATFLIKKLNYYVLILASPYSMNDPYVSEIDNLAKEYPNDIKIVYGLDFLTPHYIMQWNNTKILALLSRAEPFGLIPIEARFYNNKNLSLITSCLGGYLEQITDSVDGFITELEDKSISSKFEKIADLNKEQKEIISQRGYERIIQNYDQVKINYNLIKRYLRKTVS